MESQRFLCLVKDSQSKSAAFLEKRICVSLSGNSDPKSSGVMGNLRKERNSHRVAGISSLYQHQADRTFNQGVRNVGAGQRFVLQKLRNFGQNSEYCGAVHILFERRPLPVAFILLITDSIKLEHLSQIVTEFELRFGNGATGCSQLCP